MAHQHFSYAAIPSAAQFRKDSSVTLARRSDDRVLTHLDWVLERYAHHMRPDTFDPGMRRVILCDLFVASNYWIKSFHEKRPAMLRDRYPAVLALFEAVVNELCTLLGCTRPMVAQAVEEMFGRDLTPGGVETDASMAPQYFDRAELALLRIRFRAGVAYHYGLGAAVGGQLAPLQTAQFYTGVARKGNDGQRHAPGKDWAPFVMTLEREFYMTKHWLNEVGHQNVFHSSYTRGGTVSAAGTLYAKDGVISGIRPDSGHYKPLEQNVAAALLALQMFGVPMARLYVHDFTGKSMGTAREFMAANMTWDKFQASRRDFVAQRVVGAPLPPPAVGGNASNGSASGAYNSSGGYN